MEVRQNINILDRNLDIRQSYLLEASAGTGKTFSIENLVVRFLIENDPIPFEEILVVSFTRASTLELKSRIRTKISQAIEYLTKRRNFPPDYIQAILDENETVVLRSIKKLSQALLAFDDAQIYTIHAFCKNMLAENKFDVESLV